MHKSRKWVVLRAVTLRGDVEEGGEMRKYLMLAFAAVILGLAWAVILEK